MSEERITITLPDELKAFVDEQVARTGHADAAAYIEMLLTRLRQRQAILQDLKQELLEGMEDQTTEMTPGEWDRLQQEVSERLARRKPA